MLSDNLKNNVLRTCLLPRAVVVAVVVVEVPLEGADGVVGRVAGGVHPPAVEQLQLPLAHVRGPEQPRVREAAEREAPVHQLPRPAVLHVEVRRVAEA